MNSSIKQPDPSQAKRVSPTSSIYDLVIGLLLASTAYSFAFTRGELVISMAIFGVLFVVFLWAFATNEKYSRLSRSNLLMWFLLVIVLVLNVAINRENYDIGDVGPVMLRLAGVSMLIFILQWCAGVLNPERIMMALGVSLIPLIVYAIMLGMLGIGSLWGRAHPLDIHPNWWGELAFCFSACALAVPYRITRWVMIGLSLFLMYLVQSRGAFLAVSVMLGVYYILVFKLYPQRSRHTLLYGFVMLVIIVAIIGATYVIDFYVIDFVKNDIFLMDNEQRGTGTGFVGRSEGWMHAWEVFVSNPMLGQGMDTMMEVHSGFLRLLAEGGVVLLIVMLFLIGRAIENSRKNSNRLAFSVIIGYLVMVLTYPRFINMNLSASIFFISLFPWRVVFRLNSISQKIKVNRLLEKLA